MESYSKEELEDEKQKFKSSLSEDVDDERISEIRQSIYEINTVLEKKRKLSDLETHIKNMSLFHTPPNPKNREEITLASGEKVIIEDDNSSEEILGAVGKDPNKETDNENEELNKKTEEKVDENPSVSLPSSSNTDSSTKNINSTIYHARA